MAKAKSKGESGGWRGRLTRTLAGGLRERAQLLELLREAAKRGLLDGDAMAMVEGALTMAELQARDVMVARAEMVCIRRDDPLTRILPAVVESGHSRFPVVDGDRDDVVGILLAKDLLRAAGAATAKFDMREFLRPAVFVPEAKRLDALLKEFRGNRNHMAIVVDEYGGVAGLVTIEDVIEQIIGEIDDEFDVEEDQNIRADGEQHFMIRGATRISEFNEHFGSNFDDAEFDTVAGLVMRQLGRVPRRGESLTIGGFDFRVVRTDRRRIDSLRVTAARPVQSDVVSVWTRGARALPWWPPLLALAAGALLPLAFAPFEYWPLAILCPSILMWLWSGVAPRRAAWLGFAFGVGTFSAGTWWLYISIHGFGGAPISLSVALIVLLVVLMASYHALLGWLVAKLLPAQGAWRWYVGLAGPVVAVRVVAWLVSVRVSLGFPWATRKPTPGSPPTHRSWACTACRRCCCCRPARSPALTQARNRSGVGGGRTDRVDLGGRLGAEAA